MKKFKPYFSFHSKERSGVFLLLLLMVLLQGVYFWIKYTPSSEKIKYTTEELAWFSEVDSLKLLSSQVKKDTIYPFNPNFITDYKGYMLGMTVQEIDKLHKFRSQNKYVNSAHEFQQVTGVSNAVLETLSPYFKFPDWVTNKTTYKQTHFKKYEKPTLAHKDLNQVTLEDLVLINGIGDVFAQRILDYRYKLKGFAVNEQLLEVWGIPEPVLERVLQTYTVDSVPAIEKLNLNTCSLSQLSQIPYLNKYAARKILIHRSKIRVFQHFSELATIEALTPLQIERLPLYLSLE